MLHTQNVLVSQQNCVVDLSFSEPGLLISGGEDFDCNILSLPLASPHFTVTALTWCRKKHGRNYQTAYTETPLTISQELVYCCCEGRWVIS